MGNKQIPEPQQHGVVLQFQLLCSIGHGAGSCFGVGHCFLQFRMAVPEDHLGPEWKETHGMENM
jgi:hypothetical protein